LHDASIDRDSMPSSESSHEGRTLHSMRRPGGSTTSDLIEQADPYFPALTAG
jgi:hypothetical protein